MRSRSRYFKVVTFLNQILAIYTVDDLRSVPYSASLQLSPNLTVCKKPSGKSDNFRRDSPPKIELEIHGSKCTPYC